MSDTIADVIVNNDAFTNLYSASGISVGTELLIQNKTPNILYIQSVSSQPSADSVDGSIVEPNEYVVVTNTPTGCWGRLIEGKGRVSVQENT